MKDTLRSPDAPYLLMADGIEKACWDIVQKAGIYASHFLTDDDMKKLWQMFNRLCVDGSYTKDGPVATSADVNWLVVKIMADVGGMDALVCFVFIRWQHITVRGHFER